MSNTGFNDYVLPCSTVPLLCGEMEKVWFIEDIVFQELVLATLFINLNEMFYWNIFNIVNWQMKKNIMNVCLVSHLD